MFHILQRKDNLLLTGLCKGLPPNPSSSSRCSQDRDDHIICFFIRTYTFRFAQRVANIPTIHEWYSEEIDFAFAYLDDILIDSFSTDENIKRDLVIWTAKWLRHNFLLEKCNQSSISGTLLAGTAAAIPRDVQFLPSVTTGKREISAFTHGYPSW